MASDHLYFYEDEVYRINKKGKIVLGIVSEKYEFDSSSDEDSCSSSEEEKIEKGHIRVSWYPDGKEEIISERNVGLANRSLMPGDVVRSMLPNKGNQKGYCRNIHVKACGLVKNTRVVIEDVPSKLLIPIVNLTADTTVVLDAWVGAIKLVNTRLLLQLPDGSKCYLCDPESSVLETCDITEEVEGENFPGQVLRGFVKDFSTADWIVCSKEMEKMIKDSPNEIIKVVVESIDVESALVRWKCRIYSKEVNEDDIIDKPPPTLIEGEDLKRLRPLNLFKACTLQLGDRNLYEVRRTDKISYISDWRKSMKRKFEIRSKKLPKPYSDVHRLSRKYSRRESKQSTNNCSSKEKKGDDCDKPRKSKFINSKSNDVSDTDSNSVDWRVDSDFLKSVTEIADALEASQKQRTQLESCLPPINATPNSNEKTSIEVKELSGNVSNAKTVDELGKCEISKSEEFSGNSNNKLSPEGEEKHDCAEDSVCNEDKEIKSLLNPENKEELIFSDKYPIPLSVEEYNYIKQYSHLLEPVDKKSDKSYLVQEKALSKALKKPSANNLSLSSPRSEISQSMKSEDSSESDSESRKDELEDTHSVSSGSSSSKASSFTYPNSRVRRTFKQMTKALKKKKFKRSSRKKQHTYPAETGYVVVLEIIRTSSTVDVVWQDGTVDYGIPSVQLYPSLTSDEQEFFPGDFVVENEMGGTELVEIVGSGNYGRLYGVIQSVDHAGRTAKVKWFLSYLNPSDPSPSVVLENEMSLYDLRNHPDYRFRPGIGVLRIGDFSEENDRSTAGQIIDIYPEGKVNVWWAEGHSTMSWPQDIYKLSESDSEDDEVWEDESLSDESWDTEPDDEERNNAKNMNTPVSNASPSSRLKLVSNVEKALIAMTRVQRLMEENPGLQCAENIRKFLDVYKDCKSLDRLLGTSFFLEKHFNGLIEKVKALQKNGERNNHNYGGTAAVSSTGIIKSHSNKGCEKTRNETDDVNGESSLGTTPLSKNVRSQSFAFGEILKGSVTNNKHDKNCKSSRIKDEVVENDTEVCVTLCSLIVEQLEKARTEVLRQMTSLLNSASISAESKIEGELLIDTENETAKYIPKSESQSESSKSSTIIELLPDLEFSNKADSCDKPNRDLDRTRKCLCSPQMKKAVSLPSVLSPEKLGLGQEEVIQMNNLKFDFASDLKLEDTDCNDDNQPGKYSDEELEPTLEVKEEIKSELERQLERKSKFELESSSEPISSPLENLPTKIGEKFFLFGEVLHDHHYKSTTFAPVDQRLFFKTVKREMDILLTSLPEGIFVRAYEERMDLFSVMIEGPQKTPYENGLFFFDFCLPPEYPIIPPLCHYISYCTERLNPNLYEDGKVCVSLLGTWSGRGTEVWTPDSTLLQILVSIQGLILVGEPYFNEAGYEKRKGTQEGDINSQLYNEMAVLKLAQAMTRVLLDPPKAFEEEVNNHFREKGEKICQRIEQWLSISEKYNSLESKSLKTFDEEFCNFEEFKNFELPEFPLLPASKGFCLTLKKALNSFKDTLNGLGVSCNINIICNKLGESSKELHCSTSNNNETDSINEALTTKTCAENCDKLPVKCTKSDGTCLDRC